MADENEPLTPAERRTADVEPEAEADVGPAETVVDANTDARIQTGDVVGTIVNGDHNTVSWTVGSGHHVVYQGDAPVESADEALKRGAEPEIVNEILAGGAVAASFTAAASVAKAKLEATTQRRKNDLDAETERLRIASEERIAGFQAMTAQSDTESPEPGDA